jgi:hypothetical protein
MKINIKLIKASLWVGLLFNFSTVFGQEDEEDLGVQEVTVIKSYTPSLSEVFKIREQPQVMDSIGREKRKVTYSISSVPVASTFIPTKGSAKVLQKKKATPKYNATASAAFGNFNNILLDHAALLNLDRRQQVSWLVRFNGLLKDLPEPILTTNQNSTLIHLGYHHNSNTLSSHSQVSFRTHSQNFYGLQNPIIDPIILENLDPKQQLKYLSIQSQWQWFDTVLKDADLTAHLTTDSFETNELELELNAKFQVSIGSIAINAEPSLRYLNNKFASDYYTTEATEFASGVSQMALSASSGANRFKFKIGATGAYGFGDDFEETKLYILPLLDLSYKPKKGNFTPFLKVSGALNQNSFRAFTNRNPYTAPAIVLKNTEVPYTAELGLRTKIVSGWEFTINGHYQKATNTPLFKSFVFDERNTDYTAFRYANAFEVVYEEIEQIGLDVSVLAAFKNGGSLSLEAHWRDYTVTDEADPLISSEPKEAWNLPELQFEFKANIKIAQKLFVQSNATFWGVRKHSYRNYFINQPLDRASESVVDLPSFVDAELRISYQLNDRWEFYIKSENIFNAPQFRWANYQVYGTRFLSGIRYNFDLNL